MRHINKYKYLWINGRLTQKKEHVTYMDEFLLRHFSRVNNQLCELVDQNWKK